MRRLKTWNHWIAIGMLAMIPFATAGCYDRQELEQQAFVTRLGIDAAPGGLIDCTLRIALPTNPTSGGNKGGKSPLAGAVPVTFRAHSINEAMLLANTSIERTITFSHLTNIVFGHRLAEKGVLPYIQAMVRFREFRRTTLFCISTSTARDIIALERPMIEASAGRIADSIAMVGTRTGLYPVVHIHNLVSAIENPHEDIVAPLYAVNPAVFDDPLAKEGIALPGVSYSAGHVRTVGGNPVEVAGAAVFHGDKVVDYINGRESIELSLLRGGVRNAKFDFSDPFEPSQNVGVTLHRERSPNYAIQLGTPLRVSVDLPVDVDVTNISNGTDYAEPELRTKLEQNLGNEIGQDLTGLLKKLEVKDSSDCIPISKFIRRQFGTHAAFAKYPWTEKMKSVDLKVHVLIHIRRFGVQMEPLRQNP